MPSTYTTNTGLEKIASGEQDGTWGGTVNTNMDLVDESGNGQTAIILTSGHITSGGAYALAITDGASSEGRNKYIDITDGGDIGDNGYVQLTPSDAEKICIIKNSLSANRSVFIFQGTYNASNDYELANGVSVMLKFDGAGTGAVVTVATSNSASTGTNTGDNATNSQYSSLVTNATHTGDVTGATALTIGAKKVTLAMMEDGTDGELITYGASGVAEKVAVGTATHVLTSNGAGAAPTFQAPTGGAGSTEFSDSVFRIQDDGDATKEIAFQASGITTGNTRTITVPDANITLIDWTSTSSNLDTSGSITCATFTSTGIDDNATGERVSISDTQLVLGASSSYTVNHSANDQSLIISGSSAGTTGGNIVLYGSAHATTANDIVLRSGSTIELGYDDSAGNWNYKTNHIRWEYTTEDLPFFDFRATSAAGTSRAISTDTTPGTVSGHIQVYVNGSKRWMPLYSSISA